MLPVMVVITLMSMQSPAQDFAGTWSATFNGEPLARLELSIRNGELQGQLAISGFHVDARGDVDGLISDASRSAPIFDVALRDAVLTFAVRDGDDTDRFSVRLTDGHAILTLIPDPAFLRELAADGIAAPRPITLSRDLHSVP